MLKSAALFSMVAGAAAGVASFGVDTCKGRCFEPSERLEAFTEAAPAIHTSICGTLITPTVTTPTVTTPTVTYTQGGQSTQTVQYYTLDAEGNRIPYTGSVSGTVTTGTTRTTGNTATTGATTTCYRREGDSRVPIPCPAGVATTTRTRATASTVVAGSVMGTVASATESDESASDAATRRLLGAQTTDDVAAESYTTDNATGNDTAGTEAVVSAGTQAVAYSATAQSTATTSSCYTMVNGVKTSVACPASYTGATTTSTSYTGGASARTCYTMNGDTKTEIACPTGTTSVATSGTTTTVNSGSSYTSGSCYIRNADGSRTPVDCGAYSSGGSHTATTSTTTTATPQYYECTVEEEQEQEEKITASEEAYANWEDRKAAYDADVLDLESADYCSCDAACVAFGDCCKDFGWWCTIENSVRALAEPQGYYDFPFPGTMHYVEATEAPATSAPVTPTVVTQPTTGRTCYLRNADGTRTQVDCAQYTNVTPSTTVTTGTTVTQPTTTTTTAGTGCYTMQNGVKTPVDCPTGVASTTTTTGSTTRYVTGGTASTASTSGYSYYVYVNGEKVPYDPATGSVVETTTETATTSAEGATDANADADAAAEPAE